MPKYVVSSTLTDPEWSNSKVIGTDLAAEVPKLKDAHEGDIVVHGSAQLVQGLIDADLVDEMRLMVFPTVLGTGKRVFEGIGDRRNLTLKDSQVVGDGVAILVYERAA
jgi:dihydrofolate reductase